MSLKLWFTNIIKLQSYVASFVFDRLSLLDKVFDNLCENIFSHENKTLREFVKLEQFLSQVWFYSLTRKIPVFKIRNSHTWGIILREILERKLSLVEIKFLAQLLHNFFKLAILK